MIRLILFIFTLSLYSCNYPDIDSVPDFEELNENVEENKI